VAQGDDVGMQDREYISPELYRKYIFPRHKRLYDFIHSRTRAKLFMHSCGSIRKLVPCLIEAGVDALNPVQYSAANMDLTELKREFGSELCFWGGGMDTQHALLGPGASPQSIEAEVRRNMEILMKDGGFVFSATHNIQHETPPQTTLRVYDTAVSRRGLPVNHHLPLMPEMPKAFRLSFWMKRRKLAFPFLSRRNPTPIRPCCRKTTWART
jgi:uroporphyrinogen decarboxylase